MPKELSEAAREARREYNREYRRTHKAQLEENRRKYWERKAAKMKEEKNEQAKTEND